MRISYWSSDVCSSDLRSISPLWPSYHLSHRSGRAGGRLYCRGGGVGFTGSARVHAALHPRQPCRIIAWTGKRRLVGQGGGTRSDKDASRDRWVMMSAIIGADRTNRLVKGTDRKSTRLNASH